MKLTVAIDPVDRVASLQELHALAAGDTYNPLVLDFSRMSEADVAAIDTGSLSVVVYRSASDRTVVANANMFSEPPGKKSLRTAVLLLNQQAMKDWFASAGGSRTTCYVEVGDAGATYAANDVPIILRDFTVGSASDGYYTAAQVDDLLAAKQALIETFVGMAYAAGTLTLSPATAAAIGGVKVGAGLSAAADGTLSVTFPPADSAFDAESPNPVQNKVVAAAVSALADRLSLLDDAETGRVKALESAMAGKADASSLSAVATSGSYNDLRDRPSIPASVPAAVWRAGTAITGTSETATTFPLSGIAYANEGDMYLNTSTGNVYSCTLGGDADTAKWKYAGNVKGPAGAPGADASTTVYRSYASVEAMQAAWASDLVPANALVIISSSDADNGKLYRKGPSNYVYLASLRGPRGEAGASSQWHSGTGITGTGAGEAVFPGSGVASAQAGDMYLNSSTGNVYRCTLGGNAAAAKWTFVRCIAGSPGAAGSDGATILVGTAVTSAATFAVAAKVGDLYFNSASGMLYRCTAVGTGTSEWAAVGSLAGTPGADGATWFAGSTVTGAGAYAVPGAKVGDLYLSTNGSAYRCTALSGANSVWALVVDLSGPAGADGSVIHSGTVVTGPGSFAVAGVRVGDYYLNTSSKDLFRCTYAGDESSTWVKLLNLGSGVAGPATTTSGFVPTWNSSTGALLGAGMYVAVELPVSAAAGAGQLITAGAVYAGIEAAKASVIATLAGQMGDVSAPAAPLEGHLPAWGSGKELTSGFAVVVSGTGIASADNASDVKIPTEKAVRAALPVAATTAKAGLMTAADKAKLDGLADTGSVAEIGEALADNDTVVVKKGDTLYRKSLLSRFWTYMLGKLPSVRIDQFAACADNTNGDASSSAHGLLKKLDGDSTHFLRGDGEWAEPSGSAEFTGDTGEGGEKGLVPAPASGDAASNKFLCADGTWAETPAAAGVDIPGKTAIDELASSDALYVYDASESAYRKLTAAQLAAFMNGLTRYDTLFVPAGAFAPSTVDGAAMSALRFTNNTHDVAAFPGDEDAFVEFNVQMPDDWDGLAVKAKVHWTCNSASGEAGQTAAFTIGAVSFADGDAITDAPAASVAVTDAMIAANELHVSGASDAITPGGSGKFLHFRIGRDVSEGTLTQAVQVLGVAIQFGRKANAEQW